MAARDAARAEEGRGEWPATHPALTRGELGGDTDTGLGCDTGTGLEAGGGGAE
jgi:hypothetical protein